MTATATFLHENQPHRCGSCGSVLQGRWESLSAGLCRTLVTFYGLVEKSGVNDIQLLQAGLTVNQTNNFQKLRYFALVAKIDGKSGHWLLTRLGREFVEGRVKVAKKVFVFHNAVQGHSDETISIADAVAENPYWLTKEHYVLPVAQMHQAPLF